MNLAFGALLIFILLFPGFSFRSAYLGGPYTRKASATSLIDELIWSLAPAFVLQFLGYFFVEIVLGRNVSERAIYHLLTATPQVDFTLLESSLSDFFVYQLVIFGVAIGAGRGLKLLVLKNNLDCRYHFLRVHNDWYYLLSGKILDFEDWPGRAEEVAAVQVDVVVEGKEHAYLYTGLLAEFYLSKDQGLDRLYLQEVYRRTLTQDRPEQDVEETPARQLDNRYYRMPGDVFVIPYSLIKNINVTYKKLQEEV